jgi:hypothetical protein
MIATSEGGRLLLVLATLLGAVPARAGYLLGNAANGSGGSTLYVQYLDLARAIMSTAGLRAVGGLSIP